MHAGYAGITYLTYKILATVVSDIAYSLAEAGFTDIVYLSGHLTTDWAAKVGANRASHDLPDENYVYALPYWGALSGEDMEEYLAFDAGWHANIGETAAVLAIDEELVDLDNTLFDAPDLPMDIENPAALLDQLLIGNGAYYRISETSVEGDPSNATAELGEEYFETITHAVAELITTFQNVRDEIYQRQRPDRAQEQWDT